jgi:hypothetical protein
MQGIGVAVTPAGLQYLLTQLLGEEIAQALASKLTVPPYSMTVPDWTVDSLDQEFYNNYSLALTNGAFNNFAPVFSSYTQDQATFVLTVTAPNTEVSYTWTEKYDYQICYTSTGTCDPDEPGPQSGSWPYNLSFANFVVAATFALAYQGGAYSFTYQSSQADPGTESAHIPGRSALNNQQSTDCGFSSRVSQATETQIESINFGAHVQSVVSSILATIPGTGSLGDVVFQFAPSDAGFTYPDGGGLVVGVTGDVSSNGTMYSSVRPAPAGVPLPALPQGSPQPHVAYNVQDYEFDALFWGFFNAGALTVTLTSGDIPDSYALTTNGYAGTSLNVLATQYPGELMSAGLSALGGPTVSFQTVYQLTAANLAAIETALGSTVWTAVGASLGRLANLVYITQDGFEAALKAANPELPAYQATIEQYAGAPGAVIDQSLQCVLNVLTSPVTPVLTFDVTQQFVMENVTLGESSSATPAQTILFGVGAPLDSSPVATFVSSSLPGINSQSAFEFVWFSLLNNWMTTLGAVGKQGVPLPRLPGFNFVFEEAEVAIVAGTPSVDGYASVVANVAYDATAQGAAKP